MATLKRAVLRPTKNIYLTSKGLEDAKTELNFLRKTKRQEIVERIKQAREFGDVSENSEYNAALEEQQLVEARIEELEKVLREAKIIESSQNEIVSIGSTVKVKIGPEVNEFTIVGRVEADPSKKKISDESPLGKVLLGKKTGEEVEVITPDVRYKCKILEIN